MPVNITQPYRDAEKAFRRATTPEEEFQCLQVMLRELPKHKGSENMQAELKQKISKAKTELSKPQKGGAGKRGFRLPRQGAGRVLIIGGPNAGKSQLLASLTNAKPEIADYPFSTRECQPGMMTWEDARVQLVDTPPITADVYDATTLSLIRGADLVLLMVNLGDDDGGQQLSEVWRQTQATKTRLGMETGISENDLGVTTTKTFLVLNKIDLPDAMDRYEFFREYIELDFVTFQISAKDGSNLESLRAAIYESMDVVRAYTKAPNQKLDQLDDPFTLPRGQTVLDLAQLVHKDVARDFKSARIWGATVHDGTQVKGDYVIQDKDIVELHT